MNLARLEAWTCGVPLEGVVLTLGARRPPHPACRDRFKLPQDRSTWEVLRDVLDQVLGRTELVGLAAAGVNVPAEVWSAAGWAPPPSLP